MMLDGVFIAKTDIDIWPASREKGPSDIKNSEDPDKPLHDIENSYT